MIPSDRDLRFVAGQPASGPRRSLTCQAAPTGILLLPAGRRAFPQALLVYNRRQDLAAPVIRLLQPEAGACHRGEPVIAFHLNSPARHNLLLLGALLAILAVPASVAADEAEACAGEVLNVGFYAFFAPVSYSAAEDPDPEEFNTHLGYEADLLSALEAMEGPGLSFNRHAIAVWDDIWLQSAGPEFDIVGGGITILDSRTRDATGETLVTFTSGHITFRQSLLVRSEDAERLDSYDKLTSDLRVGALANTTGEFRLLQLTGLVDADGVLTAGVRIDTPEGTVVADGSADYVITAADEAPEFAGRLQLHPPAASMPQVIYLGGESGETELLAALAAGEIDAIARGEIGNRDAGSISDGAFVVAVLDDAVEHGGFTLAAGDGRVACLDDMINWLTDNRTIGYAEWVEDPAVFMQRARLWNSREGQER